MTEMKRNAIESIDSMAHLYTDLADRIWDHPELSLKEHYAAESYVDVLQRLGFSVETGLAGIETAFSASYGSGGPVIGILGEYDALSGLSQKAGAAVPEALADGASGHGCGHNLLGAGSMAAAVAVKEYLQNTGMPGTVVFFGCPGEEGCASKAFLARENAWRKLDAALSWHPGDVNQVRTGSNNASVQVIYRFHGIASHAASEPHMGRSALDAVELMNIGVQFLREHMQPDCRIHYAITDAGGLSPNVVQPRAEVLYMVRADKVADAVKLLQRVDKIAQGAALMTETELQRVYVDGTAELLPNSVLEHTLFDNFARVDLPDYEQEEWDYAAALRATYEKSGALPGIGARFDRDIARVVGKLSENGKKALNDFLMPWYSGDCFLPGSTDVGDVSWQTPTAQIEAVCWPADVPGHSWQVVACGKSSLAHKGMMIAAKVLAATAIDLLEQPALLQAAKEEFQERSAAGYVCPIEDEAVPVAL